MQFQRLRIAGFKSFVDPVEVRIEPGLTGVVGPNGCGKSNLLEALRWVMGANSARSLRAGGMDEVIFGGSGARPARSHAEVRLEIDNAERRAPAPFNGEAVLEVVRRIDRGAGSTYRVNGVEVRAKDVQLLFADASSGANSPSLVRQGQISELIAAKPSNRRRILEEAAGVSGLHARRHEADLRLSAADANFQRLGDVQRELEAALARLKREARQAERYRRVALDIRRTRAALLVGRWREAARSLAEADAAARAAAATAVEAAAASARATAEALRRAEALPELREAEQVAAVLLQRLLLARDRAERDAVEAEAVVGRLAEAVRRADADRSREAELAGEAGAMRDRLARESADLEAALGAPSREPALARDLALAEVARVRAEATLEAAVAAEAEAAARRAEAASRRTETEARSRAADDRLRAARVRLDRAEAARVEAMDAAEALRLPAQEESADERAGLARAEAALAAARAAQSGAEDAATAAQAAEAEAREGARDADDALRRLRAEAQGLLELSRPAGRPAAAFVPALEGVRVERGWEAAVAAAFGEDLEAALDPAAPAAWTGGAEAAAPTWPRGASPLGDRVEVPAALAARLALVAVVDAADGARLQRMAPAGARLVSHAGDLWRWDGLVRRADAPSPAAVRLAHRARLAEIERELARAAPRAEAAAASLAQAQGELRAARAAVPAARAAVQAAERTLPPLRDALDRRAREDARRDAQLQALAAGEAAREAEGAEARQALVAAETDAREARTQLDACGAPLPAPDGGELAPARRGVADARAHEVRARDALEGERRARQGRLRRREALGRELLEGRRRADVAEGRLQALDAEAARARAALSDAHGAPAAARARLEGAAREHAAAEARRAATADGWREGEQASLAADRAARTAETAAAAAREARAGAEARLEPAHARLEEALAELRGQTGAEPEALARELAAEAVALPARAEALEAHLRALERDRDALGAVNLRAADEAAEQQARLEALGRERADLEGAVARLRAGVEELNAEGRERLLAAFADIDASFRQLFAALFEGGHAELRLVESDDALEAGLEIYATPPGKRLSTMSLMSGGEQALTATALIFAVFLANPSPVCVLDEVDAPLDDANVDRFCRLLDEMRTRTATRFLAITHNPVTMSRMDRLVGVTMAERGVSQLVAVDLAAAEALVAS